MMSWQRGDDSLIKYGYIESEPVRIFPDISYQIQVASRTKQGQPDPAWSDDYSIEDGCEANSLGALKFNIHASQAAATQ
jgi:hypothetical protein